uniref:Uncharacterized protein n=1 Tax=Arundo donax TaxID=35708 RepID=A0A0A8ZBE7_ARUDO
MLPPTYLADTLRSMPRHSTPGPSAPSTSPTGSLSPTALHASSPPRSGLQTTTLLRRHPSPNPGHHPATTSPLSGSRPPRKGSRCAAPGSGVPKSLCRRPEAGGTPSTRDLTAGLWRPLAIRPDSSSLAPSLPLVLPEPERQVANGRSKCSTAAIAAR